VFARRWHPSTHDRSRTGQSKLAGARRLGVCRLPPTSGGRNRKKSNISKKFCNIFQKCCNISQNVEKIVDEFNIS
jgi:hypothetical protein